MADEILDIADEKLVYHADGVDAGVIADKRFRIDTRKWLASKLKSRKYGEKVQQEITGPDSAGFEGRHSVPMLVWAHAGSSKCHWT